MLAYVPYFPQRSYAIPLPAGWVWWSLFLLLPLLLCLFYFRKRFLTIAAITTLLTLLAMTALMIASWTLFYETYVSSKYWRLELNSRAGRMQVNFTNGGQYSEFGSRRAPHQNQAGVTIWRLESDLLNGTDYSLINSKFLQNTLGFQLCWYRANPAKNVSTYEPTAFCSFTCPYWFIYLAAIPALIILARQLYAYILFRRSKKEGLCHRCGYDLRASKLKCPECGTPIPLPSATTLTAAT